MASAFEDGVGVNRANICVNVQNLVQIGPTVAKIMAIFRFFKMAAVRHLEFVLHVF